MPPNCTNCINIKVIDADVPNSLFSARVTLSNPFAVTGYDVRGIVFLRGDQQLVSPDNWTGLFDVPGDLNRNPFQAFCKESPSRVFGGHESHSATYRLYLPPGNMAVNFAVEASYPSHCPEPYEMIVAKGIDLLDTQGV